MKKALLILLAGVLLFCLTGCLEDTPAGTGSGADGVSDSAQVAEGEKKDVEISIVSTKIGSDYQKKPILLVEYEFTNNTDKANSFTFLCQDSAFQNGVECSNSVFSDDVDTQQQLNDVKPGTPYKLTVGYQLQDRETDVELEITDLFGDETYLKQTVHLK